MSNVAFEHVDITTIQRGVIIHGCNAYGVMGAGVALAIKNKWPTVFKYYKNMCESATPQSLLGMSQYLNVQPDLWIGNLITQCNFGSDGKTYADINAVQTTIEDAVEFCNQYNLPLYMPKIGCGYGGLDWDTQVLPIVNMIASQSKQPITVCIYGE